MTVTPEDIIKEHTAPIRALATEIRRLVREAIPEATERAYPGWHGIGYRHPDAGYLCAIFPASDHVKLGFERGAGLPDPEGILVVESRKQVRYVVLRPGDRVPTGAIRALLGEAVAHGLARR